jgi:general stress protein 13
MTKYQEGKIVKGTVTGIESYGIFVSCDEFYSGLIHISEISHGFVKNINDFVKIGDIISVQVLGVDEDQGQLKLSIKNIDYKMTSKSRRKKIVETTTGFTTLYKKLAFWIEESLKKS